MLTQFTKNKLPAHWLYAYAKNIWFKRNDRSFKRLNKLHAWIVVPALGLTIPLLCGILEPAMFPVPQLFIQFALFVCVAQVIYRGNMFFLYPAARENAVLSKPFIKIVITYFMVNIVYSGMVALASLSSWNLYIARQQPFTSNIILATLVIMVCVLFINNVYQVQLLKAEKKSSADKLAFLETARLQAELQSLNSQLDPHFLYNALTSLSYLIQKNPSEADQHNARLASLYRYVVKNKCSAFVSLSQEIEFCREYFFLQQLRFGNSALLQVINGDEDMRTLKVPPLAVQSLIENAFKHNSFSEQEPLLVQVHVSRENVRVSNSLQPALYTGKTTGTGLSNLNQRILLLTRDVIRVEKSKELFSVTIPLVS